MNNKEYDFLQKFYIKRGCKPMKCAIILAGGKGTRMKTDSPKVMCEVIFEPMIKYVIDAVK